MYKITSYQYINNNSNDTILYLHGWGCNYHYLCGLENNINLNHLFLDLPGFGKNEELQNSFTLLDYSNAIIDLIKKLNIKIKYIVGHSFGGKLAIYLSNYLNVNAYFLISPSILHKRHGIKYFLKIYTYKFLKKFSFFDKITSKMGSEDYKNLNNIMKKTMSNIINESVKEQLLKNKKPIVLIYPKEDKIVPYSLLKKVQKICYDCQIIKIDGDHFTILNRKQHLSIILKSLVESTYDN